MTEIASVDAKSRFSELLKRVTNDREQFIVTVRGKPTAMLGPVERNKLSSEDVNALLGDLRAFRARVNIRGPILKSGETWKDFARDGLN